MIMSSHKLPQIPSLGGAQVKGLPIIERIYPKASELSEILNYNPCPECSEVFLNPPNLEMHLQKCHGHETARPQQSKENKVFKQYYCPEASCKYSGTFPKEYGIKYFTQHKYLKQHYVKVHMEKKFVCELCDKGFATVQLHKRHLEVCGHKFTCSCGAEYKTVPALLTHASRKKHTFIKSWTGIRNRKIDKSEHLSVNKKSEVKLCDSVVANTAVALSGLSCQKSVDVGVQTEPTPGQRRRRNVVKSPDTSRQTQTVEKRTRISSETQTVGEYHNKAKKNVNRRRKKSMETQTKVVEQTVVNEESLFSSQDVGLSQLWLSSGTKTSSDPLLDHTLLELTSPLFEEETVRPPAQNNLFNDLNTDSTDQFLKSFLEKDNFEDDGKSCSIETQTEFTFESLFENYTDSLTTIETQTSHDMWDQYNNTCTQTCDDILLAFTDIETQTAWTDICTESKTVQN